jgi:NAD(P)-dependent dehydrogenase (short-subunit alcohol dehydrogenase family)
VEHILITGSNRGIGLDLTRRYAMRDGTLVFATCRNPDAADELNQLAAAYPGRIHVIALDVTDQQSLEQSIKAIQAHTDRLDLLINNAGTFAGYVGSTDPRVSQFGALEVEPMLDMLRINSVAPVMVVQAYVELLRRGTNARIVNVSSDAGSITLREGSGNLTYAASKAALNMLTRCLAGMLRRDGITVISLHPGWIQTDMGGPQARMTLEEAIPGVMQVIDNLTITDTSQFYNWDGKQIPW